MVFMTFHILGMPSSQLTFIYVRGVETTNQMVFNQQKNVVYTGDARFYGKNMGLIFFLNSWWWFFTKTFGSHGIYIVLINQNDPRWGFKQHLTHYDYNRTLIWYVCLSTRWPGVLRATLLTVPKWYHPGIKTALDLRFLSFSKPLIIGITSDLKPVWFMGPRKTTGGSLISTPISTSVVVYTWNQGLDQDHSLVLSPSSSHPLGTLKPMVFPMVMGNPPEMGNRLREYSIPWLFHEIS